MRMVRYLIIIILLSSIVFFTSNQQYKIRWLNKRMMNEYKAVTYNIHHGTSIYGIPSLDRIAQILNKEDPDFVALQEVDRYHIRSGFYDQIKWLAEQLDMYSLYDKNMNYGLIEYGNGLLSKYPMVEWGRVELAYETEPRSLLWAKVKTEHGYLIITSLHLGLDTKMRSEHLSRIEAFLRDLEDPVLLMGDFNMLPNNQAFLSFRTTFTGNFLFREIPTYLYDDQPIQIDYILGKGIVELDQYSISSTASDHYPFVLIFKIKPNTSKREYIKQLVQVREK